MRKFAISAVLAASLAGAGLANASTTALSFDSLGTSGFVTAFSGPSFDDFYTFSVPTAMIGTMAGSAISGITFSMSPTFLLSDAVLFTSVDVFKGAPATGVAVPFSGTIFSPLVNRMVLRPLLLQAWARELTTSRSRVSRSTAPPVTTPVT